MTQKSFFWNGASVGDADTWTVGGGYHMGTTDYESSFIDIMSRALWNGTEDRGVLYGWANTLAVTGNVLSVDVNTGAAIIYGLFYENTVSVNVAVVAPTIDTRIDRIVVRRNWTTQTARITRIAGTEGGGVPAITQSPAPDGSGIYDIPLAQVSITTGGVITVTDEREYCLYSTGFKVDEFATAQLVNSSVDFAARATRQKRYFLGGGDLHGSSGTNYFTYYASPPPPAWASASLSSQRAATWAAGTGAIPGWQVLWACGWSPARAAAGGAFRIPADYVGGTTITTYVWWIADWTLVIPDFYIITSAQVYRNGTAWFSWSGASDGYTQVEYTTAYNQNEVYRVAAFPIYNPPGQTMAAGDVIQYWALFDSNTGYTEQISILGVEFVYQGKT